MFEEHVEKLIGSCGISVEKFFEALRVQSKDGSEETHFYVHVLLSVTEYGQFLDMIRHYKIDHANK